MSILIGRIENLFWNNSDYKFPNGLPTYDEEMELKQDEPNMNDFLSGTIYLYGENWNHCKFKGSYYFLHILQTLDEDKKYFLYGLTRDLWLEVLQKRPKAIGDLLTSNNDKLLEKNLNRTISVLDNPARVVTINFGNVDFDWRKNFVFKESKNELRQTILSRTVFDNFASSIKGEFAQSWKKINDALYAGSARGLKKGANDGIFIISQLESSITTRGWKHLVREKINNFIKSIATDAGKNLKISKVNSASFSVSKINGNYCITHKQDGISTSEENLRLKHIDLSGLTDIIPINIYDLKEIEPRITLGEGAKPGLFDIEESKTHKYPFLAKLRRKAYLPLNAVNTNLQSPKGFWPLRQSDFNLNAIKDPQIVNWSSGGREGKFEMWYIDNINFFICFDGWNPIGEYNATFLNFLIGALPLGVYSFNAEEAYNRAVRAFKKNSYFDFPKPWIASWNPFGKLKFPVVPFGLLIFGIERRFTEWKRYEYIGNEKKTEFFTFNGIKETLLTKYSESDFWWSKIRKNLSDIQPTEEFTKFILDNYNFSFLAFLPNTKYSSQSDPYLATDGWGTYKHTRSEGWVGQILMSDISNISGEAAKKNPYSDERYPAERTRVDTNITNLFNREKQDLPEGLSIEQGDYFFSDQDYEIIEYPETIEQNRLSKLSEYSLDYWGEPIRRLLPFSFLAEDLMVIKGGKPFNPGDRTIVLCTSPKGELEIRFLYTFEKLLSLSNRDDEIVESVDGLKERKTKFSLLKKVINTVNERDVNFDEKLKKQIIYAFYTLHKYKTKINGGVANWTWFNEEDFSEASDEQILFDLVGTDWYAFFAKGKISLIAKNKTLFEKQTGQSNKLLHNENKDLEISLLEKINQKVRFQFLNAPYYLNWKTSFSDEDKMTLSFETISPTDLNTQFEQYFLKLDTEFDNIYYENISIPKKQDKSISVADSIQLERLHLDLVRDQYSYQIDSDRLAIANKRYEENIRRAQIDLEHQRLQSYMSLGLNVSAGAINANLLLKNAAGRTTVKTVKKGWQKGSYEQYDAAGNLISYGSAHLPTSTQRITTKPGKMPNIVAGAIQYGARAATNLIMDHAFRFPERQKRINFDKQIGASELALQSLAMNTAHIDRQKNAQLAINQISNKYDNPMINERETLEEFMSKSDWHGKALKPAHLIVFIPSEEQLIALKSYKEEFGVLCDIPDIETYFYDGMEEDIIRYRNLDDAAITGLANPIVRDFLKARLMAGLKIVKTTTYTYRILTSKDYKDKIWRLNSDLLEKQKDIIAKDKQLVVLNDSLDTIANAVREECAQKESELQKRIREIENQVNNVNRQLREKVEELEKIRSEKGGDKGEIAKKQSQIDDLNAQLTNKINELQKCKDDAEKRNIEIQNLKNELQKTEAKTQDKENQINDLNQKIEQKENELRQIKEECDRVKNTLQNEHKQLQEELRKHKVDVEDLTQQLNNERIKCLNEKDEINKLKKQIADSKTTDEDLKNLKEEHEKIKKELEEAKKQSEKAPKPIENECEMLTKLLNDPYEYKVAEEDKKPTKLEILLIRLSESLKFLRSSKLDQMLFDLEKARPIITGLESLENISLINNLRDQVIDKEVTEGEETKKPWSDYVKWLDKDGDMSEAEKAGYDLLVVFRANIKPYQIHALKSVLDELNWLTYNAKEELKAELENNRYLQLLFSHVYPGKLLELYEAIFGDPNISIIRKRVTNKIQCVQDGKERLLTSLSNWTKDVKHGIKGVPGSEAAPDITVGKVDAKKTHIPNFFGEPLNVSISTMNKAEVLTADIVGYFEDKYFKQRNAKKNPNALTGAALESYYWRYMKKNGGWVGNPNKGGGKFKLAHMTCRFKGKWISGRYIIVDDLMQKQRHLDVVNNVEKLLKNLDDIVVDSSFLDLVMKGKVKLIIRVNDFTCRDIPDAQEEDVEIPQSTLHDFQVLGILDEFIKFLFIFDRNKIVFRKKGNDYDNNWPMLEMSISTGADIDRYYKNLGAPIDGQQPPKRYFSLGAIYNFYPAVVESYDVFFVGREDSYNNLHLCGFKTKDANSFTCSMPITGGRQVLKSDTNNTIKDWLDSESMDFRNPKNAVMKFLHYFYEVQMNSWHKLHPWYLNPNKKNNDNPMMAFMDSLYKVANY